MDINNYNSKRTDRFEDESVLRLNEFKFLLKLLRLHRLILLSWGEVRNLVTNPLYHESFLTDSIHHLLRQDIVQGNGTRNIRDAEH